ncbi:hypothetical protein HHI36_008192 [Cryptolaemus montrouzieri]|uniref:Reverse transcriptase domain-containing protein n=1 Tax=Cryptolaemus montrouzieri TaxID=559131 RepID=A0ABD2MRT6_9CUCU
MRSYLKNRYQQLHFKDSCSQWKLVNSGVPQSSILGPLLFIFNVNDLPYIVKSDGLILYADDTIFLNIGANHTNKLKMTANKPQELLFQTKPQGNKYVKLLGIILEPDLGFGRQIEDLVATLKIW